jgi:hypothetical protein
MSTKEPFSVDAARAAAGRQELDAWVVEFLESPGSDNALLAAKLQDRYRWWLGPVRLPLDELHRLAGPSDQPVLVEVDDDEWRDDVEDMKELIDDDWEPPPVIVTWQDGRLVLEDGNHRAESLRRAGEAEAWAVVGFDDPEERARFVRRR